MVNSFLLSLADIPIDFWFLCKYLVSYICIGLSKRYSRRRFDLYDYESKRDPCKLNFIPPPEESALESPLSEDELVAKCDEVMIYGVNSKSEYLLVRVSRVSEEEAESWIHLKLSNGKEYQLNQKSNTRRDNRTFNCGGLQMHYLSPMRKWRIFFNGFLRDMSEGSGNMVHIKFAFLWIASSDAFDFQTDVDTNVLATALAKTKWKHFSPPLERLHGAMDFYGQAGVVLGTVSVVDSEEQELYLFGEKLRFMVDTELARHSDFFHVFGETPKQGRCMHVIQVSIPNVVENLTLGFVVEVLGDVKPITQAEVSWKNTHDVKEKNLLVKLKAGAMQYELEGKGVPITDESGSIDHYQFRMNVNSTEGSGFVLQMRTIQRSKQSVSIYSKVHNQKEIPLVVHFSDEMCQNSDATGGKGSSLSRLTELSHKHPNFSVPNGIVVTTASYQKFITEEILLQIQNLEKVLYNSKEADFKEACHKVMNKIVKTPMPDRILQAIETNLQKAFPDQIDTVKFAVRSSATGEDTEQMSAAGQMETYLGISGLNEIVSSVKKCWASQFSYIAVQYKKQYGQIINSPMAVVIQEMVPCDVAGVLFTCDPLTGSPTVISITANYGLGESVVSGSEEPDCIQIKRHPVQDLSVSNKTIGSKARRIVLKDGKEGTKLEVVREEQKTLCCVSDEMALRLCEVALKIEESERSYRDVEWGFWNDKLYVFQSRPVTSGMAETDFEIEHEFDAPLRGERDAYTVSNVGEVMPGAASPLGLEIYLKMFARLLKTDSFWKIDFDANYFFCGMLSMSNHLVMSAVDFFRPLRSQQELEASKVAVFGRIIDDQEIAEWALERCPGVKPPPFSTFEMVKMLLFAPQQKLKRTEAYASYRIQFEKFQTAAELFEEILHSCNDLSEILHTHTVCTSSSSIWNMIIFIILRTAKSELDDEVYSDFANLVTGSKAESADVPGAMEDLALQISKDIKAEEFKEMEINNAVNWLKTTNSLSGVKYHDFLLKHGHRCLKEFDIYSTTWAKDPKSLVQLLKNLVGNVKVNGNEKKTTNFDKLISGLKNPLGFKSRLLLRFALPMSRRRVQQRETSKSRVVKGLDAWRQAYRHLAHLMVVEGRIPDEDLLFFMTLEEIKELLQTRNPKIITKTNQRRRYFPILEKYIFPEISKGLPKPINMDTPLVINKDNFSMTGIPVSRGVTKGYIRVALSLEEASLLKPGEILVTYGTDIGWSPYFPMLAGVVTELGGLISHGAVVCREYGLPCIAGLHGATRQFQTGDYCLLDGNKGIFQKLPSPSDI